LNSLRSSKDSTFTPASNKGAAKLRPDADGFAPKDCLRLPGPHPSPLGIQTPTHGIQELEGRLERLAFPSEEVLARGRAPLETYTTTTSEHGDIYRATPEYIEWLGSRIPGYGALDRVPRVFTRTALKEMGREPGLEVIDF
jgi:hypothetical protein